MMIDCGESTGIPIEVFGPETHLTSVISYALGVRAHPETMDSGPQVTIKNDFLKSSGGGLRRNASREALNEMEAANTPLQPYELFNVNTFAAVYGMQPRAVQNMLDFDHLCQRKKPSICCVIYPFSGNHFLKFYWGASEILIPGQLTAKAFFFFFFSLSLVYQKMEEALQRHPQISVIVNFASFRSVFSSTDEALSFPQIRTIAIIAEGVPENKTKSLIRKAKQKGVTIIGPATVGGIKPGCFRIGNTGGMIDNIIASKLYRPGSVAYVSRSGGMSNELNNIVFPNSSKLGGTTAPAFFMAVFFASAVSTVPRAEAPACPN